ncbi:MAG: pyruvate kinase [Candidatus Comchoanobacterales bacterium]
MNHRCKLIATLGPGCDDPDICYQIIKSGVNIARINMSHGTLEQHYHRVEQFKTLSKQLGVQTGIMLDLQGPKIRIGSFINDSIELLPEADFKLSKSVPAHAGNAKEVAVFDDFIFSDVDVGQVLCLDDGRIELQVVNKTHDTLNTKVLVGGILSSRKGLNVRGGGLSAPSVTDVDLKNLAAGLKWGINYVAVSFVKSPNDIVLVRNHLKDYPEVGVIAKIECAEAVDDLQAIIDVSDGIMIARGDLAIEVGDARVPVIQKEAIRLSRYDYKPVIVATQMLDSMVENPIPTRAETSDVANAVMDGADAIMMSAETAVGKHPIVVVSMAINIISEVEKHLSELNPSLSKKLRFSHIDEAIAMAAMYTANRYAISAIVTLTESGMTPLMLSRIRTDIPIFAVSEHLITIGKMCLFRGVYPIHIVVPDNKKNKLAQTILTELQLRNIINEGDIVMVTKGDALGESGGTNTLKIIEIKGES